jgi:hypothetical protein
MATTFARLRIVLQHIRDNPDTSSVTALAADVRRRRLMDFRVRGEGRGIEDFMSESSIRRLIRLLQDLGLVSIDEREAIALMPPGAPFLRSDTQYKAKIDTATRTLLLNRGMSLVRVQAAIDRIQPPRAPDAATIFEEISTPDNLSTRDNLTPSLNSETFSRLLFLLACAGGLERTVHVHYHTMGT